jgi:beta-galactosidase
MRGIKEKPFWIMEQQAGTTGWETLGRTPRPGQLRLWTMQSVAHGADAVFYFRWRTCLYGTEQYWHGILPHNGIPGKRYNEIKKTIQELRPVMEHIRGGKTRSDAALLFSYDQNWAFEIQPHHPDLDYIQQVQKYHAYFHNNNIPVDFIRAETDFSGYKLIIAPLQFLVLKGIAEKIKEYVANGGCIVLTMRTGVKDENNVCLDDSHLPCGFNDLLGIEIQDYDCLRTGSVQIGNGDEITGAAEKWCDIIDLKGAQALVCYCEEFYKGVPAVTKNIFGNGSAYYIGFEPDESSMNRIMDRITQELEVNPIYSSPEKIEIISRPSANGNYYFVLNHSGEIVHYEHNPEWKSLLETDILEPYGIAIYYKGIP